MCLSADVTTHDRFFACPGFCLRVVNVTRCPEKVNSHNKDYTRMNAVTILSHFARTRKYTEQIFETNAIEPLMDIIRKAGKDGSKWRGGDAPEFWANAFFMNLAQDESAVFRLCAAGVVELLRPLLRQDNRNSLVASATVAFLVGSDREGEGLEILKDSPKALHRVIDMFQRTLECRGGEGYERAKQSASDRSEREWKGWGVRAI